MSDRTENTGNNKPLFQGIDAKEQVYAPEQRSETDLPEHEVDVGGTAAAGTANVGSTDADTGNRVPVPVVPVRPDMGSAAPIPVPMPAVLPDDQREEGDTPNDRTRG